MKALILAGGFGTRLKEVISDRPKVMAPVNGKPFLEYIIQLLRRNGFKEIVISLGYLGDYIKAYFGDGINFGVKIEYAMEDFPLGTGGALKNAEAYFKEPFLVVNGDTYLETDLRNLIAFHNDKKSIATIALALINNVGESGLVSLQKSGKIRSFKEKTKISKRGFVNAGYYFFTPKIFKYIPSKKRLSLEKIVFPKLVNSGLIHGFPVKASFLDIGKPESYEKAKAYFQKRKTAVVETKVPVRVSFAGGGTDLPEYFNKYGGRVFSGTIGMFAHVKVQLTDQAFIKIHLKDYKREEIYSLGKILPYDGGIFDLYKAVINRLEPDLGMDIDVWGDFPGGTGLASSSAVCAAFVAAILALGKENVTKEKVAKLTIEIERDILKIPGGWQDQYATAFGGFNLIDFLINGDVRVRHLKLSKSLINKLEKSLLLFYIGAKRAERDQQSVLRKSIKSQANLESMKTLKILATKAAGFFKGGKVMEFGKLLDQAWKAKKATSAKISDLRIDELYEMAIKSGAYGGKGLGAGGGGCLLICAPTKSHLSIIRGLRKRGVIRLPLVFDFDGVQIKSYES
ncbi:MAG: sugar phosphate nucleotidyltransferase [Candidatus Woesebacteria bacterium]|nr:sugar phosphate nucleotidyltransferase [Candidatus Woesebacteria bacterium]